MKPGRVVTRFHNQGQDQKAAMMLEYKKDVGYGQQQVSRYIIGTVWHVVPLIGPGLKRWLGPFSEWHEVADLVHELSGLADVWQVRFLWNGEEWCRIDEAVFDGKAWIDPAHMLKTAGLPDYGQSDVTEACKACDLIDSLIESAVRHYQGKRQQAQ